MVFALFTNMLKEVEMPQAARLEWRVYPQFSTENRWYVVEIFSTQPAPPLHPLLVDSDWSKVHNYVPDWVTQRCYYEPDIGQFYPEPSMSAA